MARLELYGLTDRHGVKPQNLHVAAKVSIYIYMYIYIYIYYACALEG